MRFRLRDCPYRLYQRLEEDMANAGLQPISWGYFYGVVHSKEFELMTAENCCCRVCRNFGFDTFKELKGLVHRLDSAIRTAPGPARNQGLVHLAALLKSVEEVARFYRSGEFQRHLEFESADPEHCMCRLLSAYNDPHFKQTCSHTRSDGTVGKDPESMLQWFRREHNPRAVKVPSKFWNDYCEVSSTPIARQLSIPPSPLDRANALTCQQHSLCAFPPVPLPATAAAEEERRLVKAVELVNDVWHCHFCHKVFLTPGGLDRHKARSICLSRADKNSRAHRSRSARAQLQTNWQAKHDFQEAAAAASVITSVRSLGGDGTGFEDFAAVTQSYKFLSPATHDPMEEEGSNSVPNGAPVLEVSRIEPLGSAHLEAAVSVGFRLTEVAAVVASRAAGQEQERPMAMAVSALEDLRSACADVVHGGYRIELRFRRSTLPISPHGAARKGLRQRTQPALLPKQIDWLKQNIFGMNTSIPCIREKVASQKMKIHFEREVNPVTRKPLWLSPDQIRSWTNRNWDQVKKDILAGAGAGDSGRRTAEAEDDEDEEADAEGRLESASGFAAAPAEEADFEEI